MPLSTTEGALVASANRGAALLRAAGGVEAWTGPQSVNRSVGFVTENPRQALVFGEWAKSKVQELQEQVVSQHSRRGVLKEVVPQYDSEVSACKVGGGEVRASSKMRKGGQDV